MDDFKLNFLSDEIFVFTPKGELRKLPINATILDFAYDIHTELGSKCIGGKVNNKLVPISHPLSNGDQAEIITSPKQVPKDDWLNFAVTTKAKNKIRDYLKQEKMRSSLMGKEVLERKFKQEKIAFNSENLIPLLHYFKLPSVSELYFQISNDTIEKTKLKIGEIFEYFNAKRQEDHQNKALKKDHKSPSNINKNASKYIQTRMLPNSISQQLYLHRGIHHHYHINHNPCISPTSTLRPTISTRHAHRRHSALFPAHTVKHASPQIHCTPRESGDHASPNQQHTRNAKRRACGRKGSHNLLERCKRRRKGTARPHNMESTTTTGRVFRGNAV